MKKRLFIICLALILLAAIAGLSCETGEQGSIKIEATLDGAPWTGALEYSLTAAEETIAGTSVASTFTVEPDTWTCAYVSGGPAGASFVDITPSPTQSVSEGDTITFTLNFAAAPLETSIEVQATLCGEPWQGEVSYTLSRTGQTIDGASVVETFNVEPDTWTCDHISGGPSRAYLSDISPSPSQALGAGGAITFILNFELAQDASIEFATWTINGQHVKPNDPKTAYTVVWGDIIDAHFTQHVAGCEGKVVMVEESSELSIHYRKGVDAVGLRVVNDTGAVYKLPAAERSSLVLSLDGISVLPDTFHGLVLCTPRLLEVATVWQLEKCTEYTKTINWLRIGEELFPTNGTSVLFELLSDGPGPCSFTLVASASVELMYDEDVDPDNNHVESPPLYIVVSLGP